MSLENEFVPYKQAIELEQLGFDERCMGFYDGDTGFLVSNHKVTKLQIHKLKLEPCWVAPLYQQAFKFLLDQLEFVSITYFNDGSGNLKEIGFKKPIADFDTRLECLIELINLVKFKKK
jgi:hypothetical protein